MVMNAINEKKRWKTCTDERSTFIFTNSLRCRKAMSMLMQSNLGV